ncbi:hypothetical protein CBL_01124 [Carabus blaptoides fortunei]
MLRPFSIYLCRPGEKRTLIPRTNPDDYGNRNFDAGTLAPRGEDNTHCLRSSRNDDTGMAHKIVHFEHVSKLNYTSVKPTSSGQLTWRIQPGICSVGDAYAPRATCSIMEVFI